MTRRAALCLWAALGAALGGCTLFGGGDAKLPAEADARIQGGGSEIRRLRAAEQEARDSGVRLAGRPWYGSKDASLSVQARGGPGERPLPAHLQRGGVALAVAAGAPVEDVADMVARAAGLPVTVQREIRGPGGEVLAVRVAGGRPISHDGPLSALLDRIAGEYDLFWSYDGRTVRLEAARTRSWTLPIPPGTTEMTSQASGAAGGSGRGVELSRSLSINAWAEAEGRIGAALRPPATVQTFPAAGTVSVTGRPSDLASADAVIQEIAELHSIRIAIEVGIYWVDSERTDDFRFGVAQLTEEPELAGRVGLFGGAAGGVTLSGTLSGAGGILSFTDLSRDEAVVASRTASTVTQSGIPAPVILSSSRNYVSAVTRSEDGVTVETDTVDDGISVHMLPRLLSRDQMMLSVRLLQNAFQRLDNFGGVQLPQVEQRMVANEVLMTPGETLVLSGYEQETASSSGEGGLLSSARDSGVDRLTLVVLVRPTLLRAEGRL